MTVEMQDVRVDLSSRSYNVRIGTACLDQLGVGVAMHGEGRHAVVVTDENVESPHAEAVVAGLTQARLAADLLVVPAGEESKSLDVAADLWSKLVDLGTDRRTMIIAVGGGVIGDLAGFVAATFARGLDFIQVPTTLLAQVDSSVGGKVGINLPQAKNMVGSFWQPRLVWADTATLQTLPEREYRAGLAEVVKYGVILDADFFTYLEEHVDELNRRDNAVLRHIVAKSCRLKADVVEKDEHETTGLRASLNYGHTFAHAFEQVAGYGTLLHGEAVSIGMLCASRLAERAGRISADVTERQQKLLEALQLPVEVPELDHDAVLEVMKRDKKVVEGRLRFVLPSRMGHVELVEDVPTQDVEAVMS